MMDQATKASCANMDQKIGVEIIEKALRLVKVTPVIYRPLLISTWLVQWRASIVSLNVGTLCGSRLS